MREDKPVLVISYVKCLDHKASSGSILLVGWFFSNILTAAHSNTCARTFTHRKHCSSILSTSVLCLTVATSKLTPLREPAPGSQPAFCSKLAPGRLFAPENIPQNKRGNIMKNTEPQDSKYSCFFPPPLLRGYPCNMDFINGSETTVQNYKFNMLLEKPPHAFFLAFFLSFLKPT